MKYLLSLAVLILSTGCTKERYILLPELFSPRFHVGQCVEIKYSRRPEPWEERQGLVFRIEEIGNKSYRTVTVESLKNNRLGNFVFDDAIHFSFADPDGKAVDCPEVFGKRESK